MRGARSQEEKRKRAHEPCNFCGRILFFSFISSYPPAPPPCFPSKTLSL